MDLNKDLFTILVNAATLLLIGGISWGVYKTKIANITEEIKNSGVFKKWVYTSFDSVDTEINDLEKELNKHIEQLIKEVMLSLKDVEKSIWLIENRCASREAYTKTIPQLTDDLNKLRIEVSTLPSKLSSDIAKSFSEEYQKIISVIVNKNK